MTVLPVVFVLLITAVIALLITLVVLGISFGNLQRKSKHAAAPSTPLPPTPVSVAPNTALHEKAEHILRDAEKKAEEIIKSAHTFDQKAAEDMDKALTDVKLTQQQTVEEIAQDILVTYKTLFEDIKKDNINTIKTASQKIQEQALLEISDFKRILDQETVAMQKIVGQKIEAEYHKATTEIDAYKTAQLKKLDTNMELILTKAAQQVLGKVIPIQEHHALLVESLEKAKKEGVFDHA